MATAQPLLEFTAHNTFVSAREGRSMYKRIELVANVAIIIAAVLLAALTANKFFFSPGSGSTAQAVTSQGVKVGDKVALPDFNWAQSERTLVVALSTNCHFCTESAPFYQRVAAEILKHRRTRLVTVVPQSVEVGRKYLDELGVAIDDVRQSPLNAVGVRGTPTLILVDKEGIARRVWVGKLPDGAQSEVISQL
jgi:hypothetical protein